MDEPSAKLFKYTYYAALEGACIPLFSLFSPREPTTEEVRNFRQQFMTKSRNVTMPRPTHVGVEELSEFDAGAIHAATPVNGNGGA